MKNKRLALVTWFLFAGILSCQLIACSPVSPPVSYHSLVGLAPAPNTTKTPGELAILVGPVSIPDILKNSQITTGNGSEHYQRSEQHRWAGEVDRDFAWAVAEQVANRLGTEQVAIFSSGQYLDPTHQIILDVLTLDGVLGKEANLIVRWTLVYSKDKTAPVTRRSTFTEQPADGSHDAWVTAQRHNVKRFSEEIAAVIKLEH